MEAVTIWQPIQGQYRVIHDQCTELTQCLHLSRVERDLEVEGTLVSNVPESWYRCDVFSAKVLLDHVRFQDNSIVMCS